MFKQLRKETSLQQNSLKNQEQQLSLIKEELKLLKQELGVHHDEMLYNRLVSVVYFQLKRLEESIELFTFEAQKGKDGIRYLLAKINLKETEVFDKARYTTEKEFEQLKILALKELVASEAVAELAFENAKCVLALKTTLDNANCSIDQKKALHQLFVDNISNRYFLLINKVIEITKKKVHDIPADQKLLLFQKESFLKDRDVVKNFKLIIDFKKAHDEP